MPVNVELMIALAVPIVLLTVLRINAAMVFLSLCLGSVLVTYVSHDAGWFVAMAGGKALSETTLNMVLLFAPVVLTAVMMIFSVHGKIRVALNALPAAGVALLGLLLAVPLFTPGLRYMVMEQSIYGQLSRAEAFIVGVSALVSLLFLWSHRRYAKKHEDKRRR